MQKPKPIYAFPEKARTAIVKHPKGSLLINRMGRAFGFHVCDYPKEQALPRIGQTHEVVLDHGLGLQRVYKPVPKKGENKTVKTELDDYVRSQHPELYLDWDSKKRSRVSRKKEEEK